uniref:Uncharacterized protein n=1 Tax=Arundo donax TaxID=35708 RepID=A0A0A9ECZ0_ARUDO
MKDIEIINKQYPFESLNIINSCVVPVVIEVDIVPQSTDSH